jgi:hypothetical protein
MEKILAAVATTDDGADEAGDGICSTTVRIYQTSFDDLRIHQFLKWPPHQDVCRDPRFTPGFGYGMSPPAAEEAMDLTGIDHGCA